MCSSRHGELSHSQGCVKPSLDLEAFAVPLCRPGAVRVLGPLRLRARRLQQQFPCAGRLVSPRPTIELPPLPTVLDRAGCAL